MPNTWKALAAHTHQVAMVASMPRAAHAMPYMCARLKPTKMATAMMKQGMMVDLQKDEQVKKVEAELG